MSDWWIYLTDNIGIAAAAVSGAMIAIERKLDVFGVLFLGMITALGGGVLRDLLLGCTPPRFFTSFLALLIVIIAATAVFVIAKLCEHLWQSVFRCYGLLHRFAHRNGYRQIFIENL